MSTAASAEARDWFVDGAHGGTRNSGSYSSPFKYYWQADAAVRPGDTVYLQPTTTYPTMYVHANGSAAKPIVIAGAGGQSRMTRVSGGGKDVGIWIGGKHLTIRNFDVTAPGTHAAIHASERVTHGTITANRVHDAGGNGISLFGTDYMTVSFNEVYNNARNTSNNVFSSGISIKGSINSDGYNGLKMRVNGNIVYANTNVPNCKTSYCWANASNSDGSGIIMDNNRRTDRDGFWYRGSTLISNNVVFGNGGRGIHLYLSDRISINGNTLYNNNRDPYEGNYRPGEITGNYVSEIAVYNNVLSSDGGQGRNNGAHTGTHVPISFLYCTSGFGRIIVRNNLGWRPQNDVGSFLYVKGNTIPVVFDGNLWGDPAFERRTLNADFTDFRVKPYSRAVNHGLGEQSMDHDMLGVWRGNVTTIGAYENPGP